MWPNSYSHDPFPSSSERRGWHFEPTEDDKKYFLEEKNKNPKFNAEPIEECNIYKSNPDELASKYKVGREKMYFFTQLNLKNNGGSRVNRQAKDGYWKDSDGYKGNSLGYQMMTLNFYNGLKSKEKKTDWLMKEYRLGPVAKTQDDNPKKMKEYVLCQIYKKCKAEKTNKATTNQIDKKKKVAKKTTKDLIDEGITNERLPTTPGMQIYPQEDNNDWEKYFDWDKYSTSDQF